MHLTESYVSALSVLIAPPERRERVAARLREQSLTDWRILLDDRGDVCAGVAIAHRSLDDYQLWRLHVRSGESGETHIRAIAEAVDEARSRGARHLMTRVLDRFRTDDYDAALQANGFVRQGSRVEFKTPLDELREEGDSPLVWRNTEDVAEAARMLDTVAAGDPSGQEESDDPVKFIESEYADPVSINRMEIGALEGKDVAFLLAEVVPRDGWSTLSYMGVAPSARGRGLGAAVQRHGMATLRAMGGKLYHGGCSAENEPMTRVFAVNGCREFARMTEWARSLSE